MANGAGARVQDRHQKYEPSEIWAIVGGALGAVAIVVLLIAAMVLFNGFVLTQLWSWFVSPLFGIREIQLLEALGLVSLAGVLKGHKYQDASEHWKRDLAYSFVYPLMALGFGWVYHSLLLAGVGA